MEVKVTNVLCITDENDVENCTAELVLESEREVLKLINGLLKVAQRIIERDNIKGKHNETTS